MAKLDIASMFKSEADELITARSRAIQIHGTDIKASGEEVEISVRKFLERMLPTRYYVSKGHLIDQNNVISPQLDITIADNQNIASLFTTSDGTEYMPIDSIYSVGEVKSTYYRSQKPIEKFSETIEFIRHEMHHIEEENTIYHGLTDKTNMRDIFLCSQNSILNRILYFMIFINSGDFDFAIDKKIFIEREKENLPNLIVILDKCIIQRAYVLGDRFISNSYPEEMKNETEDWYYIPLIGEEDFSGSIEGNHLSHMYKEIVKHLINSYLEIPDLNKYFLPMRFCRKSLLKKASEE